MFDNMTRREKIMAAIVAALLPVTLIWLGWSMFSDMLEARNTRISSLKNQFEQRKEMIEKGKRATARFASYKSDSLPSHKDAINQYQFWIQELGQKSGIECIAEPMNRSAPQPYIGSDRTTPVFGVYKFKLSSFSCNIWQLTDFVYQLNRARILHLISELTIVPNMTGNGPRAEPNGLLTVSMTLEVACLQEAEQAREFEEQFDESFERSLRDYQNIVARRDLFGLPNTAPEFTVSSSHQFKLGENVYVNLRASESDDQQELQYELISSRLDPDDPEAMTLTADDIDVSGGELDLGRLGIGEYDFTVRATDNGWPPKDDELDISILVYEEQDDPPPQRRLESKDTYVTGDSSFGGVRKTWIDIRPQGRVVPLAVGESFELDDKTWTIEKIEDGFVTISVDNESRRIRIGNSIANPEPEIDNVSSNSSS